MAITRQNRPVRSQRRGTLHDNPVDGRVLTLSFVEAWVCEFVAIEQGAMHQNLGLMCAAL